jgi:hypothetical protein
MPAYKNAIDLTMDTIARRAKSYRNLVVAVVLIGFCSIAVAVATWSFAPLAGFVLLFPVCCLFFFLDDRQVERWRSRLLADWTKGEIEFRYLREAVEANPRLPKNTLQGMLETLPGERGDDAEREMSAPTREAISGLVTIVHRCRADLIALRTVAYAIVAGSLLVAATLAEWRPLAGLVVFVAILPVQIGLKRWRYRVAGKLFRNAQEKSDFNDERYQAFAARWLGEPGSSLGWCDIRSAAGK